MKPPAAERIPCCIPFCRRTAPRSGKYAECEEIICGPHWRAAPKALRRRFSRVRRLANRAIMRGDLEKRDQAWRLDWKLWEQIKSAAVLAAGGAR